ncbi:MAG TPA: 4Fe-4S cluster-binding domain-containing protein [Pyrinomonadaceae bacterium]|nr:4Fe-4S cluster-binding domain-containing protein [Acidobacteriota bacterium]HMT07902.1 4Fe-4S cluster-binding domain-containing protein [Pyrinomonadaceae bacterium]
MKNEITFILEYDNRNLTTEVSGIPADLLIDLRDDLGTSQYLNCGKPMQGQSWEPGNLKDDRHYIWLHRIYHNSVVDGPGRRSVVQVAGCSIRCPGCYVPETHNRYNGRQVSIASILEEILAKRGENDGVTILGGEPFDQSDSVAELVARLKHSNFHIVVYTGNTIEKLYAKDDPLITYTLSHIDMLVDGPFELSLLAETGEYRGSSNQRLLRTKLVS